MNAITTFDFEETPVRAFEREDGSIWFVAADVCRALGLTNSRKAIAALDDDEKGVTSSYTLGGSQEMNIISEGGLYTLVLRSRQATTPGTLPHRFRKWVTGEVLPAIRRTGRYEAKAAPAAEPARPDGPEYELSNRMRQVELYLKMHGPAEAVWMAEKLGFPRPPAGLAASEPPPAPAADWPDLLAHLLGLRMHPRLMAEERHGLRRWVLSAARLAGDPDPVLALRSLPEWGLRVDGIGATAHLVVANRHPVLKRLLSGSRWRNGAWRNALRSVPGAYPTDPRWFDGEKTRGWAFPLASVPDLVPGEDGFTMEDDA